MCNWLSNQKYFGTKYKNESELEISVFYLVPKHFRSESQLHMIWPLIPKTEKSEFGVNRFADPSVIIL